MTNTNLKRTTRPQPNPPAPESATLDAFAGHLVEVTAEGLLIVEREGGRRFSCHWLISTANSNLTLSIGDQILVVPVAGAAIPVAIGRIGAYAAPSMPSECRIEATGALVLGCGDASIQLRADGQVMIRGEDVLVRAKGTQRIRAGTVAIN